MIKILLVEDEPSLQATIKLNLELDGYQVVVAGTGTKAVSQFKAERFDLVILDVMLPELDGYDVCRTIRIENTEVPILFLTAKNESSDKILGLKMGADDYLTKPFNLEEFLLRIQILLKRANKKVENQLNEFLFGANKINFTTYEIQGVNGFKSTLSKKEVLLLKLLIERKNEVVSRETILEKVWGYDVYPSTRTIDNFILAFRKYFEKDPKQPTYFHSVRGVGYKFTD
ncbi:MAG: response regulator transcription factor [Bacteroidetes bacterium]|nr:response regulator transcription factor [Bacteroidota bacterium]